MTLYFSDLCRRYASAAKMLALAASGELTLLAMMHCIEQGRSIMIMQTKKMCQFTSVLI